MSDVSFYSFIERAASMTMPADAERHLGQLVSWAWDNLSIDERKELVRLIHASQEDVWIEREFVVTRPQVGQALKHLCDVANAEWHQHLADLRERFPVQEDAD